jgi:hypothetical protein
MQRAQHLQLFRILPNSKWHQLDVSFLSDVADDGDHHTAVGRIPAPVREECGTKDVITRDVDRQSGPLAARMQSRVFTTTFELLRKRSGSAPAKLPPDIV